MWFLLTTGPDYAVKKRRSSCRFIRENLIFAVRKSEPSFNLYYTVMAITELKRKGRKNRAVANNKTNAIKQLLRRPIIRNVDVDAIKASFEEKKQQA